MRNPTRSVRICAFGAGYNLNSGFRQNDGWDMGPFYLPCTFTILNATASATSIPSTAADKIPPA